MADSLQALLFAGVGSLRRRGKVGMLIHLDTNGIMSHNKNGAFHERLTTVMQACKQGKTWCGSRIRQLKAATLKPTAVSSYMTHLEEERVKHIPAE